jgi:hypothetical protein
MTNTEKNVQSPPDGTKPEHDRKDQDKQVPDTGKDTGRTFPHKRSPPDSIPNPMPGVDPQQTPGIDHWPAERD